jgi:hypothetical protein
MRQCPDLLSDIDLQDRTLDAHGHNFAGWLTVNGPVQRRVREFLTEPAPPPSKPISTIARRAKTRPSDRQRVAGHDAKPADGRTSRYRLARSLFRSHPDARPRPAHRPGLHRPDVRGRALGSRQAGNRLRAPPPPDRSPVGTRGASIEDVRGGPAHAAVEATIATAGRASGSGDRQLYLAVRRYVTDNAGQSPVAHSRRPFRRHARACPDDRPPDAPKRLPCLPARGGPRISANRLSCR